MINAQKKISGTTALEMYKELLRPRLIEERMLSLLRQNKISKWFSGIGQEAISVGVGLASDPDDYILPMHRNLGIFTTRKTDYYTLFCQLFGKKDGFTGGRDRSFHFGIPEKKIVGMISHLAATMPIADGLALAYKLNGTKNVAFSFCGDGATSEGDFHEALNLAGVWKLPVIFVIENNGYGLSTPVSEQFACENLADRAAGYGIEGVTVDGNDLFEVMDAIKKARNTALSGKPVMIEAKTFRLRGHEEASGTFYVPDSLQEKWAAKDPVDRFEKWLLQNEHVSGRKNLDDIKNEIIKEFKPELEKALNSEEPDYSVNNETERASFTKNYSKTLRNNDFKATEKVERRFVDAIQHALRQAFEEDESFLMLGQDIAEYGGVFKVSEGFLEQFGEDRIRNTPIIESGAVGAGIGLALAGFKPVIEMQFADFISCAFNQIINNVSKSGYRWMPPVNITIRAPHGAGVGAGPYHSQSPEGWFMAHSGLRILVPSTVEDAQNMLYTSLFDPDPVLFFEHKKLYRSKKEWVTDKCSFVNIESAHVSKEGEDAVIITYGQGVDWAMNASIKVEEKIGKTVQVLDLRSLAPIDWNTIRQSIKNTGKVLLLQEPSEIMGPMSEISAGIGEKYFEYLDAPIFRCSSIHTPVPYNKNLEEQYLSSSRLENLLEKLLNY